MRLRGATPGSATVDIGDGVEVPAQLEITADVDGYEIALSAAYSSDGGRYEVREVTATGAAGREITGERLRAIPVATILRGGVLAALEPGFTTLTRDLGNGQEMAEVAQGMELEHVARIYRLALLAGDAPTQAVARDLGVPRSTAGRWVTRARDRGLLTVQDPRAGRRG